MTTPDADAHAHTTPSSSTSAVPEGPTEDCPYWCSLRQEKGAPHTLRNCPIHEPEPEI